MPLKSHDRILAISDLHGQKPQFLELLRAAQYTPARDQLIVCGDMVDRGEANVGSLEECQRLKQSGAIILKGNHEQFLEQSLLEMVENPRWYKAPSLALLSWYGYNGGENTLREIKDFSPAKLAALLFFIQSLPSHAAIENYVFAHAGVNPQKPLPQNDANDFIWASRDFYARPAYAGKTVIFGHTPTFCLPDMSPAPQDARIWHDKLHHDKIGIDCGCVFGGRLACLELPSMHEFYI